VLISQTTSTIGYSFYFKGGGNNSTRDSNANLSSAATPNQPAAAALPSTPGLGGYESPVDDYDPTDPVAQYNALRRQSAQNTSGILDAFHRTMPGGELLATVTGKTITGKDVPVSERVFSGVLMAAPFVPAAGAVVGNKIMNRGGGAGAPAVAAANRVPTQAVNTNAPQQIVVKRASDVTPGVMRHHREMNFADKAKVPGDILDKSQKTKRALDSNNHPLKDWFHGGGEKDKRKLGNKERHNPDITDPYELAEIWDMWESTQKPATAVPSTIKSK
jgi:hypothetical protein